MTVIVSDDFTGSAGSIAGRSVSGHTWLNLVATGYNVAELTGGGAMGSGDGSFSNAGMAFSDDLSSTDYIDFNLTFAIDQDDGETDFEVGASSHGDQQGGNFYLFITPGSIGVQWYTHGGVHNISHTIVAGDVLTLRIPTVDVGHTAEILVNGTSLWVHGSEMFTFDDSPLYVAVLTNMVGILSAFGAETHAAAAPPGPNHFHIRDNFTQARGTIIGQVPDVLENVVGMTPSWGFSTTSTFPVTGDVNDNANSGWLQSGSGYCYVKSGLF